MLRKNTAGQFLHVAAINATTGTALTGATLSCRRCIDGTFAAAGATITEDTGLGFYKVALTQADTNGNNIAYFFTATNMIPVQLTVVTTACDPTSTAFGLSLAKTTNITGFNDIAATAVVSAGAITTSGGAVSTVTSVTNGVTVTTNNDKTGYSLTQSFPANFSSLAITVGGEVTVGTNNDKTGYTASTVSDKTGYSIATGGIATGDIDATALNEIADAILDRVLSAGVDSGLNNTAARTVRQALRALRNRVAIAAGTMTVYKEDDSTLSWNSAMTRTAGDPISESNPS